MIKYKLTLLCIAALLAQCSSNHHRTDSESVQTSIASSTATATWNDTSSNLGSISTRTYRGYVGDNSDLYTLTVYNHEFSGDGLFSIDRLNTDSLTTEQGMLLTLRGADDATVWECRTTNSNNIYYFWLDNDSALIYPAQNDSICDNTHPLRLIVSQKLAL